VNAWWGKGEVTRSGHDGRSWCGDVRRRTWWAWSWLARLGCMEKDRVIGWVLILFRKDGKRDGKMNEDGDGEAF
jgi:hypothetical protein